MKGPPSDRVETRAAPAGGRLAPRDRRRLTMMRQEAGAVEIRITVQARPAGRDASWRPIRSGTRQYTAHSAFNAEQLILGGPLAGTTFAAPRALLEFYEQLELDQHQEKEWTESQSNKSQRTPTAPTSGKD